MKVYHQNQGEGRANTSLCPRQLVPLELLLKDPECDCRTYADPYPKDTDRRTLRPSQGIPASQTRLDSPHPLVPGVDMRQDSRERAADDPSDTRPALALLSSLSHGLPVGGGFQIEIPNQNPNANY